jgi:two-component system alkaline phosphatase synthesis response regulator PhoP
MPASILVADDEPNIVLSLEFILKQAGYRVRVAADGDAALAAVEEEPPDLLVLDAMMPKRDGFDVCGTIRANTAWAGVRILMLTAKGSDAERDKGLALGADDYLTKPFSNREVVERVRQLLAARRA